MKSRIFWFIMINFYNLAAYAVTVAEKQMLASHLLIPAGKKADAAPGVGSAAGNIFVFGLDLIKMMRTVSIFTGIVMLLFSMQMYKKYRNNPVEVPLSTVFLLVFISIVLIVLPLIPVSF